MSQSLQKFESSLLGECYYRVLHGSGLPVYVFPKRMVTAHALFAVRYGSVDNVADPSGKKPYPDGIAHFLEHKLFSNEDGSDSFERFSAYGADANAYTSHTGTVYLFTATDRFEESFGELIDFVTHPYFTKETVKKEQGIIAEEIRMCRDNPYDRCYYNMLGGLYHSNPVKEEICGSIRSISQITAGALYDCYRTHYVPENMAIVVCGDLTVERVMQIVDAHVPPDFKGKAPKAVLPAEPRSVCKASVTDYGQVARPIFTIGVKDVAVPADALARIRREIALTVLMEMIFSESGELYNSLLDRQLVSPDFAAELAMSDQFGFMQISGEADEPEDILHEILTHLQTLRKNGLSECDFERVKKVELAEWVKGFDSTEAVAGMLLSFAFKGLDMFAYTELLRELKFEDVKALFETFFDPESFVLSVVRPIEQKNKKGE